MKLPKAKRSLILIALTALTGCSIRTPPPSIPANVSTIFRLQMPTPGQVTELDSIGSYGNAPIVVSKDGRLVLDGRDLSEADLPNFLRAADPDESSEVSVMPDPEARAGDVVKQLARVASFGPLNIAGNERHREFGERLASDPGRSLPAFRGVVGEYEMPIVVGVVGPDDQCTVEFDATAMDSALLYERSFDVLDGIVMRAGGVEAVLEQPRIIDNLFARLQTAADTPWRCVAGAMFQVQAGGWPSVQFEIVDR